MLAMQNQIGVEVVAELTAEVYFPSQPSQLVSS